MKIQVTSKRGTINYQAIYAGIQEIIYRDEEEIETLEDFQGE